jgi:hypothetical protein
MTVGLVAFLVVGSAGAVSPPRSGLVVDVSASRSASQIEESVEAAVRDFSRRAARLTESHRNALLKRGLYDRRIPFSLPVRVHLEGLPEGRGGGNQNQIQGNSIALVFDSSGPRAFPTAYRQLLQDVFNQARPTLDVIFGQPSQGGNVRVRNFDADIGDRDAVAGGYYLHDNGSGEREIRFPVYFSNEAAAVNFVHTVLLAYLGANDYGFDAFTEGLVRAATMRAVRTPGTLPAGLDPQVVESVLDNTYDVGTFYDWFNQRALGGAKFIAPNLRSVPLPPGGSLGGIYLARYQMAGSAWQKTLVEYPGFAAAFNEEFYANPGMRGDVAQLVALADQVLFTLGGPGSTLEGLPFADWFVRQHILETRDTLGPKLFVQPIPLPPIGGSPDFGVFLIQATFFETRPGGDEILLGGTSYPIFWTPNYDRIFPSGQEDSMPIAGAYGAVAPNLPNIFGGQPYRASVDIPVFDRINRTYVPAGAVATGSNTSENNFYGTVLGVPGGLNATIRIRVTIGSSVFDNIPVLNGAFGALISSTIFTNAARARVEVIRNESGVDTVFADRFVNKGPGPLALDLRANNGESVFSPLGGLPKGMSLIGLPLDPWAKTGGDLLQIAESQVLAARYNSARANYDIYPNTGPFVLGQGFFVRMDAAQPWASRFAPVGTWSRRLWPKSSRWPKSRSCAAPSCRKPMLTQRESRSGPSSSDSLRARRMRRRALPRAARWMRPPSSSRAKAISSGCLFRRASPCSSSRTRSCGRPAPHRARPKVPRPLRRRPRPTGCSSFGWWMARIPLPPMSARAEPRPPGSTRVRTAACRRAWEASS